MKAFQSISQTLDNQSWSSAKLRLKIVVEQTCVHKVPDLILKKLPLNPYISWIYDHSGYSDHADGPKVFDIILDGELLRQNLGDALLARDISTESTIQLEYTFLVAPPKLAHTSPQQDW